MLRPRPTRWFEILAARDDATLMLEALARTGAVELEARDGAATPADPSAMAPLLSQFNETAARYDTYWPDAGTCRPSAFPGEPLPTLQRCLDIIQGWARDAEPWIRTLQHSEAVGKELQLWQRVLVAWPTASFDPGQLAAAGPLVHARLVVLPSGTDAATLLQQAAPGLELLVQTVHIDASAHLLVAGTAAALQALAQRAGTAKGSVHEVPQWLQPSVPESLAELHRRAELASAEHAAATARLQELSTRHGLACALGDAYRVQWVLNNVRAIEAGGLFCWITGWSSDVDGATLQRALQHCGARALLHLTPPPRSAMPPLLLHNPPWARPFEIFSRALGMPSSSEADPTPLLAIVVPLMFGYMFGDVGQGLVIAVAAWWLRRRYAVAPLLMVGGLSAAAFGLLFGSAFGLDGLVPAFWLHPLERPLTVLLAPLVGGVALLTLGLALDALAALWGGQLRRWGLTDAALVVVYLALLATFVWPAASWVAACGALYFCAGHALLARHAGAAAAALGELVEKMLQIMINTLSFARVGAFALAHAGLSSAIVALIDAADSNLGKALVLVLGNAVVIALEAMVVSIQTTRLVLFEFFTRFMHGRGRVFRPLPAPPFTYQEN